MSLNRITIVWVIALCCLSVQAQSGRRKVQPPPTAPVPAPTPEPTPKLKPKDDEQAITFLVSNGDRGTEVLRYPLSYQNAATHGCIERLRKRSSARIDTSQRDLSRGEAIKKAKEDKTTYVVLISLIEDRMSASSSGYPELQVDYVVFAPVTAKVVASGRTYENGRRAGPVIVGRSRGGTNSIYREQSLRRAGEDAADRILKALHMDVQFPK
jgi:hypothetical protein